MPETGDPIAGAAGQKINEGFLDDDEFDIGDDIDPAKWKKFHKKIGDTDGKAKAGYDEKTLHQPSSSSAKPLHVSRRKL